jgi:magnesium-transporting ATPase (P-type)
LKYNASSPDELALANAARYFGLVFEDRDEEGNIILHDERTGLKLKYQLLNVIEFTSDRKRMSIIVRTSANKIICMTKGADSIIIPRLSPG